ncbi:glycoside hydrolase family 3 C-terminal domain-containing protein [Actinacidiphila acididurans]|uniref:Glycoside hydrolase family 3 C-terminal domain-containing protein n=1 Tax=Actinacidiphila acididurans TaxID=2784346 RepID=A0ABS2TLV4_9ACTN|nr:glycoside hydrolase family 3 C-terminal domain-containing protein [Actinacidiphila acididurans]MBM9503225.1 glycoside hydrolase family 3 C-terminal domain-containing protein [Actinacidiphila acididurans]
MDQRKRRRAGLAALCAMACAMTLSATYGGGTALAEAPRATATTTPIYLDTHYSFEERAADLVSRMTLAEKVQQLSTNSGPAIPRLGVQQYTYWSEGQHGVNSLGADQNNGGVQGGVHATSFPTNFASSMSWDRGLIYQETSAISDEVRGFLDKSLFGKGQNNLGKSASDYGSLTFWAPTVNLDRDPRWGRTDEAFGEDPYFVGQMAGQFIDGYQGQTQTGQSTTGYLKVAATAKHYALNNVEDNRTGISSDTTDTNLRDYYTAQFRSLIEQAHVAGLMTSYNAINGTPSVADTYTTNELAQRTYGFNGYITSDCGAVGTTYKNPPSGHAWAPPGWSTDKQGDTSTWTNTSTGTKVPGAAGGQAYALRAGTDLNCTGDEATTANIQAAIDAGILSEGVIDTALVKVFTIRMETGEFDPPGSVPYTSITKDQIESPAHQALATKVADNSLVLLQNSTPAGTSAPLLPADAATAKHIVVLGDQAANTTLGLYSGQPDHTTSPLQGIKDAVAAADPSASVVYDAAGTSPTATGDAVLSDQTKADIKAADLVVEFVGTTQANADEGKDRTNLAMPGNYHSLIDQVSALGNQKTALVIQSDGPMKIDDVQDKVSSIVFSGFNGQAQGTALADVLFGKQNPSGHLNFTWYKDDSQLPDKQNYGLTPSQTDGLGRTYQYFTGTPTYPFGYGLSYSSFSFQNVTAHAAHITPNGMVTVGVDVANTGKVAGATVAQLYAATQFGVPGVELPKQRLEGFAKTKVLRPGQTQHLTMKVKAADLSMWDTAQARQTVYNGTYAFQVGPDSAHIAGTAAVQIQGTLKPKVQYVTVQPENVELNAGDTVSLLGKNRWIKDDTDPANEQRDTSLTADNVVEAVNDDQSFVDLSKADVTYSSSNPAVATVDADGTVHAVADGVATIKVTVGGVSGTTPIVVHHSVSLSAPALTAAGGTITATASYTNGGTAPVSNVSLSLTAPDGWTAEATSPSTFASVAAGQKATTTWKLTAPADATQGSYGLTAQATVSGGAPYTDTASVNIPYPSVAAAYDNTGVSDDSNTKAGSFDGGGNSYSAQALNATGIRPGAAFHHDGMNLQWPDSAVGTPDNIAAGGQTVPVTGSGSTLAFLGSSSTGNASGSGTVIYTDGTTQPYSVGFADWWSSSALAGTDIAATLPYINNQGGRNNQKVHVYYAAVPIDPSKTVKAVVLPYVSTGVTSGVVAMHIFSLGVGTPSAKTVVSLRAHADNEYVTADTAGTKSLIADSTTIGAAQSYDLVNNNDGSVSLLAHANTEYVTAENGGKAPLIANRTAIGPWESFDLSYNPDGSISLRAHANNQYVSAENSGADPLIADSTTIGPAQSFDLVYD